MRMRLIVLTTLVQLMIASAGIAHARGLGLPAATERLLTTDAPGIQNVQQDNGGADKKALDINVTVGDQRSPATNWYAQPMWIAIFVLGGVLVLVLLGLAMRGSGDTPTIVKA